MVDTVTMSGGGVTTRGAGVNDMVGSGQPQPRAWRDRDGDGNRGGVGRGG